MKKRRLPTGWTNKQIRALVAYHDNQSLEELASEIKAASDGWNNRSKRVKLKRAHEAPDGRPKDSRASLD